MSQLPLTHPSTETPMERIFEKVMLRKMTEKEREILQLNEPVKPKKKLSKAGVSRKKVPHATEDSGIN